MAEQNSLSLLQAQQLYKYHYGRIEPLAMQERLITREFPRASWVLEALKVGYIVFQNASHQPQISQIQEFKDLQPQQRDRVFLTAVIGKILKIIGVRRFFTFVWVLLKHFPDFFKVLHTAIFRWKGAPPDAEALRQALNTPLGLDLAKTFQSEGSLGIRQVFTQFFANRTTASIEEQQKALKKAQVQLSAEEMKAQNQEAIATSQEKLAEPPKAGHFTSIEQFRELFVEEYISLPAIADTFQDDEIFAYMRLAGPNPIMLEQVKPEQNFFHKFPVTEEQYQSVMGTGDTLSRAMDEGRLFGLDYGMMEGALVGTYGSVPEVPKYLYSAIALFAVPDSSHSERFLKPVAIQCGQDPDRYPVLTPSSGKYAWLAAKSAIQVSDSTMHEAVAHLAGTHLLIDPFVVATHRQLPEDHCVHRLLKPHFQGTILINYGAWKLLTAPEQGVNSLMPTAITQARTMAVQGLRQQGFNAQMLPQRLKDRGVIDAQMLPLYPYRDDALALWNAIHDWVGAYLLAHYDSDTAVMEDRALQNWAKELIAIDGGRITGFGNEGQGEILTRDYLTDALTMVIFTGSVHHAAVNFPQKGIMSFTPAMPMSGYIPPEDIPSVQSEEDWCRMLPPEDQAKQQLQILQILGGVNYGNLGQYSEEEIQSFGENTKAALDIFQNRLKQIEQEITTRNNILPGKFTYEYLKPSNIPQSINI